MAVPTAKHVHFLSSSFLGLAYVGCCQRLKRSLIWLFTMRDAYLHGTFACRLLFGRTARTENRNDMELESHCIIAEGRQIC